MWSSGGIGDVEILDQPRAALARHQNQEAAMIPRGKYTGKPLGEPPADEAEHFIKCEACGGWIDCRDLGSVFDHEGPLPHPSEDQEQ